MEVFHEDGRRMILPISVERAAVFWIDAESPQVGKAASVGRITIKMRDHTQAPGEEHELTIDNPPMGY